MPPLEVQPRLNVQLLTFSGSIVVKADLTRAIRSLQGQWLPLTRKASKEAGQAKRLRATALATKKE
jgi:hypothetical protein